MHWGRPTAHIPDSDGLGEHPRHPHCDRRARQYRHELALARHWSCPARRLLHRVGGVEHHRTAGAAHDRQARMSDTSVLVAEADAALAHHDLIVADLACLVDHVLHVPRRQELALLDIDRKPLARDVLNELVWRHRKAGVCSTSTTAATSSSGVSSCTSVSTGTPICFLTSDRMRSPSSIPGPRKDWVDERLALSNEDL